MKNWSLKVKIIAVLFSVVVVSGVFFSYLLFAKTSNLIIQDAKLDAQHQINRTIEMFMVSTVKFHEDFTKAREVGKIDAQLVLEDWSRTKSALVDAVAHDYGEDAVRVRIIGDNDIFGIEPLGKKENSGIVTSFEREAAQAIIQGKDRVEVLEDGYFRVAVPLPSQKHAGCAECHQSLRKGLDSDLKQNMILGTLNVYMPLRLMLLKERGKTLQILYVTMTMLVLISIALYCFMSLSVTKPIEKAVLFTKKIAEGDLEGKYSVQQNDEIGMLAGAMNKMVGNMRELALDAKKIAGGDLTVQVASLSDRDMLGQALKQMVTKLSDIIAEINISAQSVLFGSEQLSSSSQAMSQGATEQASSLEEISSSMNEIASQTRQNSENATLANKIAADSKLSAEKGDLQMKDMVAAMREISDSSRNISKIIKIIDEIAFQTNLLALNAAVEAARAGKYGKGFAVVAEEVRNLAARSAKAAKETEEMIEGSVKKIDEGTSIAGRTADALMEIVAAVGKVTDLVAEIAAASSEQAQGVSQITMGLAQVDQVTQQNTAHAEQSASAAQELTGQAQVLQKLVLTFKFADTKNSVPARLSEKRPKKPVIQKAISDRSPVPWGSVSADNPDPVIHLDDTDFGKY